MNTLSKSFFFSFLVAAVSIVGVLGLVVHISAHELIPQAVVEFMKKNPNATPEEIEHFVIFEAPIFRSKFKNIDDLVKIVRNQNTGWFDNAYDFAKLGVKHILNGPDHILFVLSLLLAVAAFREMLRVTSAFTVAHSISLILAGLGILVISPRIIEPLIAFSIAFVALTTVFLKGTRFEMRTTHKLGTVFFFGLFHGLGFAGLLQELGIPQGKFLSSLFSFNVGIEIGQLLIVAAGLPVILLIRKTSWHNLIIRISALTIGIIGLVWGIERVWR
ncbi:MAG: HupE/UreJ family protein [Candidatus Sungbacteria bacterium]|nr:HupE/UreJ family protein [Candidatus Sungbacteria bacterium]